MMAVKPPIWVALQAHLAADRRKTVVLAVLFLVMLGIYARLLWNWTPARADAATPAPAATGAGSAGHVEPPAPVRFKPDRPLVRELARDPFGVHWEQFPVDPDAVQAQPRPPTTPQAPATANPGQPVAGQQELRLQSTISGTLPMAWINGRCVQPGEAVDGFVLEQVEPTRVVLRRGSKVRVLTID